MRKNLRSGLLIMLATAACLLPPAAFAAASIGDIANNMSNSFSSVGSAVQSFCWVMALVTGAASAFKFAAYAREPDREKISTPFMLLFVAAFFFAIPMVLDTGVASVWGDAPVKESAHGTAPGF